MQHAPGTPNTVPMMGIADCSEHVGWAWVSLRIFHPAHHGDATSRLALLWEATFLCDSGLESCCLSSETGKPNTLSAPRKIPSSFHAPSVPGAYFKKIDWHMNAGPQTEGRQDEEPDEESQGPGAAWLGCIWWEVGCIQVSSADEEQTCCKGIGVCCVNAHQNQDLK